MVISNCQETPSPSRTPEFGRAMYKYAKKLGKHNCNHTFKEIPESKSDGDLLANEMMTVCIPNSKSQPNFTKPSHHRHHQQCCSGFSATHRHKLQNNACVLI
ncbi:hypothetical protein GWI33_021910 [Rhynchophorus ferrugineus]|uniref:Uncharacterized protein n=1 Tax=Rhynchophorus ferrugineus TaxID=354439 RepID=A0A834M292_RHYFE|nr:hypothetical protein GWI33_021912 [Rhynchophorus ferrugineus]KAF7264933.1 hypothetical protein GWI33_021910 [Rhynchophorus ferrugineus]